MTEHVERTRVGRSDIDALDQFQPVAAFRWAEAAETALMRKLGLVDLGRYPRRHVEAEFHTPLRFDHRVDVRLWVADVGRTSITFAWEGRRDTELCFEGRHVAVRVDDAGSPEPLAEKVRAVLAP